MPEKIVLGLIGCGGIAQTQHLPNISRAPNIRLKVVCDLNRDTLKKVQESYGVPGAVTDFQELLGDPEIQAVLIATKDDMQVPLTLESLNAGKHVYVEKPLAETPEDCAKVVAAQKKAGKIVSIGFNRRFAPCIPESQGDPLRKRRPHEHLLQDKR